MKKILHLSIIAIFLTSCAQEVVVMDRIDSSNIRIDNRQRAEDSSISEMIAPYKAQLDQEMNVVIGRTDVQLDKGAPESTMGNWFADMLMTESKLIDERVSFAVQNRGGLRINSIPKGDVTIGKIFELMPFDNFLVIIESNGKVIKEFIDHVIKDGGWPSSKELVVRAIDNEVTELSINGELVEDDKIYYYALPDYIANGGSNAVMLKTVKRVDTGIMIRDIAINHIKKKTGGGELLSASIDGRTRIKRNK
jgi:2',3'-cyclic-nucleotide 2'-phosphodiesterase (5'-nucleotidase family)